MIDTLKENQKMFDYINLSSYHAAGYTGKSVKVCVLDEDPDHRIKVNKSLLQAAPDCEIIFIEPSNVPDKVMNDILTSGAKLVTTSLTAVQMTPENSLNLIKNGIVLFVAAGNDDKKGLVPCAKDENWISVGALQIYNGVPKLFSYSSVGAELDTVAFIPYVEGTRPFQPPGTSFSCPFLVGIMACYYQYLDAQYGRFPTQTEVLELIKTQSEDLEVAGFDIRTGYGILILPEIQEVKLMNKTDIILHHSATWDDKTKRDYDAIKAGHIAIGDRDIAYHWLIEFVNGLIEIEQGRQESDNAAACPGKNYDAIHICLIGNFEETMPTEEQYQAVADKCKDIMTRWPIETIGGHRDYYATACPGANFDVEHVRELVKGVVEVPENTPIIDVPSEWAKDAWEWAKEKGINDGQGPRNTVTEEQVVTMLYRYDKIKGA